MSSRIKRILLLAVAAVLLFGSGRVEQSLNVDRDQLGLTIAGPLTNAPPMLAFTTVALGGFRGLISNYLWIRANDLQLDDKFFEATQLADWITDLEPHFAQVWAYQAWNMAWNISVKFKENAPGDYSDRWRWVQRGIELLRDNGLRYNPDNVTLYQQLAWIFQSKMGQNMDDANAYYKSQWADAMTPFFGPNGTNFAALLDPQTPEEKTNALVFRQKFKMDPVFAEQLNQKYGPFDWRLPEASAIYWAAFGLKMADDSSGKVQTGDLIILRRIIYQSMEQLFYHGRIITDPYGNIHFVPDLALANKAYEAYQNMYVEETDSGQKQGILSAERNFLRDAVYFLYGSNRSAEAAKWFKILAQKFPDKPLLDTKPDSLPKNLTLDDYCIQRVQEELGDTSQDRTTDVILNLLTQSYVALAMGDNDHYLGYRNIAKLAYASYTKKTSGFGANGQRVALPPFENLDKMVLSGLLDPKRSPLPFAARAQLRTQLNLPPETAVTTANISTNTPPPSVTSTNAAATVQTNSVSTNSVSTNSAAP